MKYLVLLLWILTLLLLIWGGLGGGTEFVHSRGSILCLSCMGLEDNENF